MANASLEAGGRVEFKAGKLIRGNMFYRIKEIHLQNQGNTFTESGKYIENQRNTGVSLEEGGLDSRQSWAKGRKVDKQENWRNILYTI